MISVCILAKDEAQTIEEILRQLAAQTFVAPNRGRLQIHVVANGCTDDTVDCAKRQSALIEGLGAELIVHDLHQAGKSRAWNTAVHDLTNPDTERYVFLDADIALHRPTVISELLATLEADPAAAVCGGYPVKDVHDKTHPGLLDRFSLAVSAKAKPAGVINGSLYIIRGDVARSLWLPNDIPGEDGFLNALVTTRNFSVPPEPGRVRTSEQPTHSFKAHSPLQFFSHERRMVVGTVINRWIFEHFWALDLKEPASALIREWNAKDPGWVEKIIRSRSKGRAWVVPNAVTFGRLLGARKGGLKGLAYIPVAVLATIMTLAPAASANGKLKKRGAAQLW